MNILTRFLILGVVLFLSTCLCKNVPQHPRSSRKLESRRPAPVSHNNFKFRMAKENPKPQSRMMHVAAPKVEKPKVQPAVVHEKPKVEKPVAPAPPKKEEESEEEEDEETPTNAVQKVMDVSHGVYEGSQPVIVESESSESDEFVVRGLRQADKTKATKAAAPSPAKPPPPPPPAATPAKSESSGGGRASKGRKPWISCLPVYHPCRRHKQCCEGHCNWRIGMRCDYAFV